MDGRIVSHYRIIDRLGGVPESALYPLARLQQARASVSTGDAAAARTAYPDFFAAWKDGDRHLPVLVAARHEYEQLHP